MDITSELELLIARLNRENEKDLVCEDARRFLASVAPAVLHDAERQLTQKGVPVENLHKLCAIHLEMFVAEDDPFETAGAATGSEIIDTLYREHEVILGLLEELEGIGHSLENIETYEPNRRELLRLPVLMATLTNVESHFKREEQIVFCELERIKARCSPHILTAEHQRVHDELERLREAVDSPTADIKRFRQKTVSSINVLVPVWWRHIFKENNIIFPSFTEHITEQQRLCQLKTLSDSIGYAGFENLSAR